VPTRALTDVKSRRPPEGGEPAAPRLAFDPHRACSARSARSWRRSFWRASTSRAPPACSTSPSPPRPSWPLDWASASRPAAGAAFSAPSDAAASASVATL